MDAEKPIWVRESEAIDRQRAAHPDWDNRYEDGRYYRLQIEDGSSVEGRWLATDFRNGSGFVGGFLRRGTTSTVRGWINAEPLDA